jgi:hypothetical protein
MTRTITDGTTDMRASPDWIVLSMAGDGFDRKDLDRAFAKPVVASSPQLSQAVLTARGVLKPTFGQNFAKNCPARKRMSDVTSTQHSAGEQLAQPRLSRWGITRR